MTTIVNTHIRSAFLEELCACPIKPFVGNGLIVKECKPLREKLILNQGTP
jgi:hypothetical protein